MALRYGPPGAEPSVRRVEPYRQVLSRGRWYLLAWDLDRDDWRTFRLDRVSGVAATGVRFTPRPLPAATAVEYLDGRLRAARHRVVLVLDTRSTTVGDRLGRLDCEIEPAQGARCRVTAHVDSFEWLLAVLLSLDVDFEILQPAAFVEHCDRARERLARAVGGPARSSPRQPASR